MADFFHLNFQMSSRPKILVAIDFDHTLIDCNIDAKIKTLTRNSELPEHIEKLSKDHNEWTVYMAELFKYLFKNNVTEEDYKKCLAETPLVEGMQELLLQMYESGECEIIILSDANSFFIDYVLEYNKLSKVISKVFTNPAEFSEEGCLQIKKFQESNDCSRCPDNLCKGFILKNYTAEKLAEGQYFYRILYIGDGANDVCPALKLTANDYVFARVGFRLLRSLEKMPARDVKSTIVPWENGHDIKKALMT